MVAGQVIWQGRREARSVAMHSLTMDKLKRSFSFGTNLIEVGTPTFSRVSKPSPPTEQVQATSQQQPAVNAQEPQKLSTWACEAVHEELFCLEELVRPGAAC